MPFPPAVTRTPVVIRTGQKAQYSAWHPKCSVLPKLHYEVSGQGKGNTARRHREFTCTHTRDSLPCSPPFLGGCPSTSGSTLPTRAAGSHWSRRLPGPGRLTRLPSPAEAPCMDEERSKQCFWSSTLQDPLRGSPEEAGWLESDGRKLAHHCPTRQGALPSRQHPWTGAPRWEWSPDMKPS